MSIEVKIPAVGESITSGVLSVWHKKTGEVVSEGEALFTLETDKISTEVPAIGTGKLQIQIDAGQEVKIGQTVGLLDDNVKASAQNVKPPTTPVEASGPQIRRESNETLSPAARRIVEEEKVNPGEVIGTGKHGHQPRTPVWMER